jgi:hypothetical protein
MTTPHVPRKRPANPEPDMDSIFAAAERLFPDDMPDEAEKSKTVDLGKSLLIATCRALLMLPPNLFDGHHAGHRVRAMARAAIKVAAFDLPDFEQQIDKMLGELAAYKVALRAAGDAIAEKGGAP